MTKTYRNTPADIKGMPSGIPYIVGNEAAERYSFYGMKSILMVFLTTHVFMKPNLVTQDRVTPNPKRKHSRLSGSTGSILLSIYYHLLER